MARAKMKKAKTERLSSAKTWKRADTEAVIRRATGRKYKDRKVPAGMLAKVHKELVKTGYSSIPA